MGSRGTENRFWFADSEQIGFQHFQHSERASYPPRVQDEYVFVTCLKGSLAVEEDGVLHQMTAGDMFIGNSLRRRRSDYGVVAPCEGLSLIVPPRMLHQLVPGLVDKFGCSLLFSGVRPADHMTRFAEEILDELAWLRPGWQSLLDALAREFVIRCVRVWACEIHQAQEIPARLLSRRQFVSAIDFMRHRGKREFSVEDLSAHVGLNTGDLIRRFRSCTGTTPLSVYNRLLMERARLALEQGDIPLKEISYRLGFSSPSHFSSLYRKLNGAAPGQRRQLDASLKIAPVNG